MVQVLDTRPAVTTLDPNAMSIRIIDRPEENQAILGVTEEIGCQLRDREHDCFSISEIKPHRLGHGADQTSYVLYVDLTGNCKRRAGRHVNDAIYEW